MLGTREERGLLSWKQNDEDDDSSAGSKAVTMETYNLPFGLTSLMRRVKWLEKVPISPTFEGFDLECPRFGKFWRNKFNSTRVAGDDEELEIMTSSPIVTSSVNHKDRTETIGDDVMVTEQLNNDRKELPMDA